MPPVTRLRAIALFTAVVSATAGLSGCGSESTGSSSEPKVVAAFYPLAWAAERVAGDHAEVVNLTQPGTEPHDLELGPKEVAAVAGADLVIHEHGLQPAVDAAIEQNAEGTVVDVADVINLRPFADHSEEGHVDEHAGEGHDHGDGEDDPHFWHDPLLMASYADEVADQLADLDPGHADDYVANAARLRADLTALDKQFTEELASCKRDLVVVNHDAFGYLARYGLHLEPIVGLSPDAEPTAAQLSRLHQLIEAEGLTTVFSETLVSPKTAETLASDLNIKAAVLDPIEGLTAETSKDDYLSLMTSNLAKLRLANDCA